MQAQDTTNKAQSATPKATIEPKKPGKRRAKSVRSFVPTAEHAEIQLAALGISTREGIFSRLSWRLRLSFATTVTNALTMDAQGYTLVNLGQMRYEVRGSKQKKTYL